MIFGYQQLILNYQLDLRELPKPILQLVMKLPYMYTGLAQTAEGKAALKDADEKLSLAILQFLGANMHRISSLVCEDCRYQLFYHQLFDLMLQGKRPVYPMETKLVNGERFRLHFDGQDHGYHYYTLSWNVHGILSFELVLRVHHELRTLEPIAEINYSGKDNQFKYTYYDDNTAKFDQEAEKIINDNMDSTLISLMDDQYQWHQPAINQVLEALKIENHV